MPVSQRAALAEHCTRCSSQNGYRWVMRRGEPIGLFAHWRVPVLRRRTLRVLVESLLLVAAWLTLIWFGGFPPPVWLNIGLNIVTWGWWVLLLVRWRRVEKPLIERVRTTGGRVCPRCGYDLEILNACGTCPECGEEFSPETLRRAWF